MHAGDGRVALDTHVSGRTLAHRSRKIRDVVARPALTDKRHARGRGRTRGVDGDTRQLARGRMRRSAHEVVEHSDTGAGTVGRLHRAARNHDVAGGRYVGVRRGSLHRSLLHAVGAGTHGGTGVGNARRAVALVRGTRLLHRTLGRRHLLLERLLRRSLHGLPPAPLHRGLHGPLSCSTGTGTCGGRRAGCHELAEVSPALDAEPAAIGVVISTLTAKHDEILSSASAIGRSG